jgi:hypothetical protein
MAVLAFGGGALWKDFLLPYGVLFGLLGLAYLWAFVFVRGISDDLAYQAGLGMGFLGGLVIFLALLRGAIYPMLVTSASPFLVPWGLILAAMGLLYVIVSAGMCSDRPYVVLTRRELSAFFYSPIAYFVLIGITVIAWIFYVLFLNNAVDRTRPLVEPIIRGYIWGLGPVLCLLGIVPFLTMRVLSEEKRTGTMEVLMTVPVNEVTVVLSKFTAVLIFFLICWLPWALFLVDLRLEGGKPFDGRPLLSFFVAMTFMGAAFLSMGLFFSSLTSNQIVSAVLTFAGMLLLTGLSLVKWWMEDSMQSSPWFPVVSHVSYLQLWWDSVGGALLLKPLLFQLSATIFWLFLTVQVLDSRKWR